MQKATSHEHFRSAKGGLNDVPATAYVLGFEQSERKPHELHRSTTTTPNNGEKSPQSYTRKSTPKAKVSRQPSQVSHLGDMGSSH